MNMRKFLALVLGLGVVWPVGVGALEVGDLVVEIREDFTVGVGEEFSLDVVAAYDETESCGDFLFDWRQLDGPVVVKPLNDNVVAPKFRIEEVGTYEFGLTIEAQCGEVVESEMASVVVTVMDEVVEEEEGMEEEVGLDEEAWEMRLLPEEVTLEADGVSSWNFNFYVENAGVKPDGVGVDFMVTGEGELEGNAGEVVVSGATEDGRVGVTYFAPLVEAEGWEGGEVVIRGECEYGAVEARVKLEERASRYRGELRVAQVVDDFPYLVEGKEAVGRVRVFWEGGGESVIGVMDVTVNREEVGREEAVLFREWSEGARGRGEDFLSFVFLPEGEEADVVVALTVDGERVVLEKKFKVRELEAVDLKLVGLRDGLWSEVESVDVEERMEEQLDFLGSRVPSAEVRTVGGLDNLAVMSLEEIDGLEDENVLILLPPEWTGEEFDNGVRVDGDEFGLAWAFFRGVGVVQEERADAGVVWMNDKVVEVEEGEVSLTGEYGVSGLGFGVVWDVAASLSGVLPFGDIDESHWAYEYLREAYGRALVGGYADGSVGPDREITRAEFLKILLAAGRENVLVEQGNTDFSDVVAGAWYVPYVEKSVRLGLVGGYADGTFRPGDAITRAEAVKILVEYLGLEKEDVGGVFGDVEEDAWYAGYVGAAREAGLVGGYADGTFRPGDAITRAEAVKVIEVGVVGF